jgi:hypothetical protein
MTAAFMYPRQGNNEGISPTSAPPSDHNLAAVVALHVGDLGYLEHKDSCFHAR